MRFAVLLFFMLAACSAKQQATERDLPQCMSLCANQFAACTQEFPGDASACLPARNDCDKTCRGEEAIRSAEDGRQKVLAPLSKPVMIRPDAGTDSGQALD